MLRRWYTKMCICDFAGLLGTRLGEDFASLLHWTGWPRVFVAPNPPFGPGISRFFSITSACVNWNKAGTRGRNPAGFLEMRDPKNPLVSICFNGLMMFFMTWMSWGITILRKLHLDWFNLWIGCFSRRFGERFPCRWKVSVDGSWLLPAKHTKSEFRLCVCPWEFLHSRTSATLEFLCWYTMVYYQSQSSQVQQVRKSGIPNPVALFGSVPHQSPG